MATHIQTYTNTNICLHMAMYIYIEQSLKHKVLPVSEYVAF